MQLNVPFCPMTQADRNYCGQFVLKCILKHFLGKEFDREYLARLSQKSEGGFTLTLGLAYAGLHEGLRTTFVTTSQEFVSQEGVVGDVGRMYGGTPVSTLQEGAQTLFQQCKELGIDFQQRTPTLEEICHELDNGHLVVAAIDYGKIYGVERQIFHFALLTGYDHEFVYFHDVGPNNPTSHKQVSKELFLKAWSASGTDMDTIIFSRKI
jgi:hypothetical protein